jgi:hypothetical protein
MVVTMARRVPDRVWTAAICGLLAALALLAAGAAFAEPECRPVAIETVAKMWNDFIARSDVKVTAGGGKYDCVTSEQTRATACQTHPDHPAHPSVVVRRVVRGKGGWWMQTEATTAAACAPYLAMLREFEALTEEMRERLARERAARGE